ncbi:MAG: hypothetical protein K6D03_02670 [Solobacterium sp.]|nr:hypothetical protein [Solobacterium sp.]
MAVQYQKQSRPTFEPEEENIQEKTGKSAEKNRSYYLKKAAAVIAVAVLGYSLRAAVKYNHFFLQDNPADNYLSAEEFPLINSESGKSLSNLRSFSYSDQYTGYWDPDSDTVETSRGIRMGSSWEDIVQAYGDCTCSSIYYYEDTSDISGGYSPDNYIYLYDPITVSEFNEKYVKTGICDPHKYFISLTFEAELIGSQIVYTDAQYNRTMKELDSNPWYGIMGNTPRRGWYTLNIDYAPDGAYFGDSEGGVYMLSSSLY